MKVYLFLLFNYINGMINNGYINYYLQEYDYCQYPHGYQIQKFNMELSSIESNDLDISCQSIKKYFQNNFQNNFQNCYKNNLKFIQKKITKYKKLLKKFCK